jgi:hypothetical protein
VASPTVPINVGEGAAESQFLHKFGETVPSPAVPVQYCVGVGTPNAVANGVLRAVGLFPKKVGRSFETTVPAIFTTSKVEGAPVNAMISEAESPV